jgi:hypothetical protein
MHQLASPAWLSPCLGHGQECALQLQESCQHQQILLLLLLLLLPLQSMAVHLHC